MRAIPSAAALFGALILSACGIKGPLYLPEIPAAPPKASPANSVDHNKATSAPSDSK